MRDSKVLIISEFSLYSNSGVKRFFKNLFDGHPITINGTNKLFKIKKISKYLSKIKNQKITILKWDRKTPTSILKIIKKKININEI